MFARVLQKYAIYFGFLAIFAVFSVLSPHFLQGQNLSNILVQASVMAIIAIGQTYALLSRSGFTRLPSEVPPDERYIDLGAFVLP